MSANYQYSVWYPSEPEWAERFEKSDETIVVLQMNRFGGVLPNSFAPPLFGRFEYDSYVIPSNFLLAWHFSPSEESSDEGELAAEEANNAFGGMDIWDLYRSNDLEWVREGRTHIWEGDDETGGFKVRYDGEALLCRPVRNIV